MASATRCGIAVCGGVVFATGAFALCAPLLALPVPDAAAMWLFASAAIVVTLSVLLATLRLAFGERIREGVAHLGLRSSPLRGCALGVLGSPVMACMAVHAASEGSFEIGWMDVCVFFIAVPAIVEELKYRAFICWILRSRAGLGLIATCTSSAVVFVVAHMLPYSPPQPEDTGEIGRALLSVGVLDLVCIGVTGGYFAWVYLKTDMSLWACATMHAMHNLAAFGLGGSGGATRGAICLVDLAIGSQLLLWVLRRRPTVDLAGERGEKEPHGPTAWVN